MVQLIRSETVNSHVGKAQGGKREREGDWQEEKEGRGGEG